MSVDSQPSAGPVVTDLIARIRAVSSSDDFGPAQIQDVLTEILNRDDDWLDQQYQQRDGEPVGKLYSLFRADDGRCSMLVGVFAPGAELPIHNHGSWAVVGVYRGREQETRFRRLDDGTVSGRAHLEPEKTWVNSTGTVTVVPDGVIHTVEAIDGQEAVSIHVYGTDIITQPRSTFDLAGGTEEPFSPPVSAPDES